MAKEPPPLPGWRRAVRVGLLSFVLALLVNWGSSVALNRVHAAIAILIVLLLVAVGIVFDMLGTSVTAAELPPFNAMAAKKVPGARQALWLVRSADAVASFCNDVVGDVSGAVAGAAGATVALKLAMALEGGAWTERLLGLLIIGLISGLTVGGKAAGKTFAITRATTVVMVAGRIIYWFEQLTGRSLTGGRSSQNGRRRNS
ncbi:CBS domain containing-hemolysin-like protein [Symbiobacterium terraclitae]|uniref:CBS domain containing-hemolysin-like protein n=1 Tax=Symbiobacterium terraclitae TaxID=557451 RepID=A0ABS4JMC4_9FIRM|nr:hypothetical protein [Symbiobacterium terraclitae]MBP2016692.1 CBS domain containing-hemolysin-like protein [Symbiobacterium terraclitae]